MLPIEMDTQDLSYRPNKSASSWFLSLKLLTVSRVLVATSLNIAAFLRSTR